ncbi:MAG: hypothetical protein V4631_09065 [Pseudomonadota bacterium]
MSSFRGALRACLWCAAAGSTPVQAAPPGWVASDAATLDSMRGGFTMANGLTVSLGLERLVAINGAVVARTHVQVNDIGKLSEEQARQTSAALSSVKLIQNGSDNIYLAGFADATLGGTVIQNTLSDQHIGSRTVITASVNSIGLLKALNFNGNVSDAIARAAGPR